MAMAPREYQDTWRHLDQLAKVTGGGEGEKGEFDAAGMETPYADIACLLGQASKLPANPIIVEVGTWAGRTALALARAREDAKIFCVDTWEGTPGDVSGDLARNLTPDALFGIFVKNTRDYLYSRIFPCKGTSAFWANMWPLDLVDMVWLDADHSYASVRNDIKLWKPRIQCHGILCGHDHGAAFPGVERAVSEMFPDGKTQTAGISFWHRRV